MVTNDSKIISDEFWIVVRPLIPLSQRRDGRHYKRKAGAGRKPLARRLVLEAILHVLRTGCPWKALPKERYGSPSSVHRYYRSWLRQGFFTAVWQAGLAESDEMEGIAWKWSTLPDKAPSEHPRICTEQTDIDQEARMWIPCKAVRRTRERLKTPVLQRIDTSRINL